MSALAFQLPARLEATEPPEAHGVERDAVRLMVADRADGTLRNTRFRELPQLLDPGDLLVINVSATLAAAVSGRRTGAGGDHVRIHFSTPAADRDQRWWVVEVRTADGSAPGHGVAGETIVLGDDGSARLELAAPYAGSDRLLLARLFGCGSGSPGCDGETVPAMLARLGQPVRYGHLARPLPLDAFQTVYATAPGSAEMPSAGRPFTERLITALVAQGIGIAPICLHAGVSSPERHEPPFAEPYEVPAATARAIAATHAGGRRVIAVGTTVVRALETAASAPGEVRSDRGWTRLVIDPAFDLQVIDGVITGWHEPEASHLMMLEAIAGPDLLERSYAEAIRLGYRWHEFGDSNLILR
jgi:S-adenosylmethionine:tRNA ribosyltransferase-isomerase